MKFKMAEVVPGLLAFSYNNFTLAVLSEDHRSGILPGIAAIGASGGRKVTAVRIAPAHYVQNV